MNRESGSSHSHDTCFLYTSENLFFAKCLVIALSADAFCQCVLSVILDHYGHYLRTGCCSSVLNSLYRSGTGADDVRRYEAVRFAEQLACQHHVALLYHRLRRFSDMLTHGKYQFALGKIGTVRRVLGVALSVVRMHAALKCLLEHMLFPSFMLL